MQDLLVSGQDVLNISQVSGDLPYALDTKMSGKSYRRFAYGGKVFISNDERFYASLSIGDVYSVNLGIDAEGQLSMFSFISFVRIKGLRRNEMELNSITTENYRATLVSPEDAIA